MLTQAYVDRSPIPDELRFWLAWLLRLSHLHHGESFAIAKRILDVHLCLVLLPFALIAMGLIALAIKMDSPGPILFVQERVGRAGRRFRMIKFRTLKYDYVDMTHRESMKAYVRGETTQADNHNKPRVHKPFDGSQVTRVGQILRRTSLDELPQIFNVLAGDMSVVGPRPNVVWEVQAYRGWHTERLEALPGITGLAQVRGRSGLTFDQMARYDIEYVRNQSLMMDLRILWSSLASVVSGYGAG